MKEQKLGILGGMGPQATQVFYQFVLDRTDAARDQDHLPTLILSDTKMPDRTAAILGGEEDRERVFQRLLTDARLLESAGCTAIAVPCNTSHFFLDRVQEQIGIPILHMIRETAKVLAGQGLKRPGILATDGTIRTGLYQKEFAALGIEPVTPSPQAQKQVMSLIYDDVKAGHEPDMDKFDRVMWEFARSGCDRVILACTELSVLQKYREMPEITLDAMDVLVRESIIRSGAPYRL